jgi:hypothetical protein
MDDVRLDAFGGLVENQERGLEHQRAPDGELLLLTAREIASATLAHALQHRKEIENPRRDRARSVAANSHADLQILFDRELRKRSHVPAEGSRCRAEHGALPATREGRGRRSESHRRQRAADP